ncbi:ATP-binding cassette domain-containing protein [Teredinibacter haidensis]|uniref:ATP-binding cassette domain-containing protein n=1 Tax=Teredinibacter haidensis TaxID=2731755 RepID=UPI00094909C6|nr:ATP-binding cassette domain-containing protein [Teredinibacter haidensis]
MNSGDITLSDFHWSIGEQAILKGINFSVKPGEKIALLGSSGAGKSSLLMALYQRVRNQASFCPQQLGLVDTLSVYHNIYMGQLEQHSSLTNLWNLLFPLSAHKKNIHTLASTLGIEHLLSKTTNQLSGGERQRVAIARALYREQSLFLGDEPTTGLDPSRSQQVLELILARHQTVIIALHDPQLALSAFDRIVGVHNGHIIFDRPSASSSSEQLNELYAGARF